MRVLILNLILSLAILTGCNSDDDGGTTTVQNDAEIRGTWQLVEQRNTEIPRSVFPPEGEEPVEIVFLADFFSGSSANNSFSGSYITNNGDLTFRELLSSENDDTPWATQFYFGLSQAYNSATEEINLEYEVSGNKLIIEYATNSEFIFEKQ